MTVVADEVVTLAHGAGGRATQRLVEELFLPAFANPLLAPLDDAAVLDVPAGRLAFTTDSYVVRPLFFPGGDIGELAVNGTVNDLAVSGATPLALTVGFVIEEGLPVGDLRRITASLATAARRAGVVVAAGDTKVVERGAADGLFLCTAGIGLVPDGLELSPGRVRSGDVVLVSGTLADHGMAVLVARGDLALEGDLRSDTAPLHREAAALCALGPELRFMRDPTRGGLATALNELAGAAGVCIRLHEAALPIRDQVAAACEILGIDPLYVANEGKLLAVVSGAAAPRALAALGPDATVVGTIVEAPAGLVVLETALGGTRIVDVLVGDPLPRIC